MPLWITVLLAVAPYVVPPLIALLTLFVQRAMQNLPAQKRDLLDQVARIVVPSVEQTASDLLNGPGKKEQAMQQAAVILQHLGIKKISPAVLSAFIEAAVKAENLTKQAQAQGHVVAEVKAPMTTPTLRPNG